MSKPVPFSPWLLAAAVLAASGCNAFDEGLLEGRDADPEDDAGSSMDGGSDEDAAAPPVDSGSDCVPSPEACNGQDDDCDDAVDENTLALCQAEIVHSDTGCFPFEDTARCVWVRCHPGYDNCDGDPTNGCEPECDCNPCEDAGSDRDAGE